MTAGKRGVPSAAREFDPVYYSACYAAALAKGADPRAHYSEAGWKLGLNPNPFFSTNHYLSANPEASKARVEPFAQFIESAAERPYASPLFDPKFYLLNNPDVSPAGAAVEHYWSEGRKQGRSPNALFDVPYYRSQLDGAGQLTDYLEHYLETGWKAGLAPHPLFEPEYYERQLSASARLIPPLVHYLQIGWKEGLSPHPLFDPEYYVRNSSDRVEGPPLLHYLMRAKWNSTPHYLFSDSYYITTIGRSGLKGTPREYQSGPPLLHYCEVGASSDIPPHPLFDLHYYKEQAERLLRENGRTGSAVSAIEQDPLRHYCTVGVELGISPTPLFDPEFYRAQFDEPLEGDPLGHYLSDGFSVASPHPAVDLQHYARSNREFEPHDLPVILDILMTPKEARVSPHPAFDPAYYLSRNPDIKDGGVCPIQHFIEHGLKEARQPNALFTYPYAHRLCSPSRPRFWNPVDGYFRSLGNKRPRILFLSHDASQSGAPLVLLGLIKQVSAVSDIECITVLGAGGPLVEDFVHSSLTYVVAERDRSFLEWSRHSASFKAEMSAIVRLLKDNPPELVVCNSLESRHLADFFVSSGFGPLVTLVHEVADPYDSAQLSPLLDTSELSLFVSEYQLGRMRKKLAFDEGKTAVVQFGSLNKWFGSGDREIARDDVEAELGLAEDARIVLACGTMNFRKGIDLFAEVACTVLERSGENTDLHFVWVGGGETHYDSAYYWAEKMVRDRGFDANVHFVGERFQTEKYFLSADLFILTSRADPFPCVVQEAMSCSLPVIAFEGSSGAAEAVGDSGVIVPFGAGAMAKAVEDLLADDLGRKKRSRRAREILETKNTTFSYTNEIFEHVRNSAPTIADRILARPDPRAHAGREDLVVLVATSTSDSSEASLHAQQVVKQLIANGLDAEMLFVRGPSVLSRAEKMVPLPEVPFSFLYPKSQSPEHVREEIVRHLTTDRGPCVFVPSFDDAVLDVIPALPPHVATMAIVHGETPQQLERVYSLSRHFDRIVCTSPDAREELVEANPRLKNCLSTIPPRVAVDANKVEAAAGAPESRSPASEIRLLCAGMDNGELSRTVSVVKLAKLLRDAQVSFRLSVLVDAAEARAIRAVAPDLLSNGNLSLLEAASLAEIRAALAGNDLFFFGGAGGSSSFLVAEAMAAGCIPILRVSGQPASSASALKDGKNSHFLDNGSLRNLVQILRDHQQAPDRLARMSKAARRTCLEQMADEKLMGAEYADACRSALQTRAKRGKETQFGRQRAGGLLRTG